jgi:hypothetical protein
LKLSEKSKITQIYYGPILPFFIKHAVKNPPKVSGNILKNVYLLKNDESASQNYKPFNLRHVRSFEVQEVSL